MVERLGEISCPTTVIVGEHDTGLRGAADVFAEHVPGAELVVIAGAGHSPQEDQPQAWIDAVQGHLARDVGDDADRPRPLGPTQRGQRGISTVRRSTSRTSRPTLGATWAVFVRSAAAHAELLAVDIADARAAPGVDRRVHGHRSRPAARSGRWRATARSTGRSLARDRVRFVGEPVAVVVADDACAGGRRGRARRSSRASRCRSSSTRSRRSSPARRCCSPSSGRTRRPGRPRRARGAGWEAAEVVVRARFDNHRIAPVPMEPNGCVVVPDGAETGVGRRCGRARSRCSACDARSRACSVSTRTQVVVRAPAVGGGFGAKGGVYVEQLVVAALAQSARPGSRVGRDPPREPAQHDARSRSGARRRDRRAPRRHDRRTCECAASRTSVRIRSAARSSRWSRASWRRARIASRRSSSTRGSR